MSRRYETYITELPHSSGGMFKWAVVSAGIGIAFGAGMVMGQGGARREAAENASAEYAESAPLKAASESDKKLREIREQAFQFQFHKELKGQKEHPAAEALAAAQAKKEEHEAAAPKAPKIKTAAHVKKENNAHVSSLNASAEDVNVEAPGNDSLGAQHSATENKDEHQSNMAALRQAFLKVMGGDAPTWDEKMTPPPLSSVKKSTAAVEAQPVQKAALVGNNSLRQKAVQKKEPTVAQKKKPVEKALPVKEKRVEAQKKNAFALQVASVTSQEAAERVAAGLKAGGFRSEIVQAEVKGQQVYRVRVPGFSSRDAADKVKSRLGRGFVTAN